MELSYKYEQSHLNTVHYPLIEINGIDAVYSCMSVEMHIYMGRTVFSQHPTVLLYLMILLGFPLQTNSHRVVTQPFKICSREADFRLCGQGGLLLISPVKFCSVCISKCFYLQHPYKQILSFIIFTLPTEE